MPATFGREILGRDVVDQASDKLGVLADFRIDMSSGRITALLVVLENDLDPAMLPSSVSLPLLQSLPGGKS